MTDPDETVIGQIGHQLDAYLTRIEPYGFSRSVLVARVDKLILDKGYWVADQSSGIPNTTRIMFVCGFTEKHR
jgi:hypothetical protein